MFFVHMTHDTWHMTNESWHIQGDLWEVTVLLSLWRIEKCLDQTSKKIYTRVYIGRFDYLPWFNFGPKKLAIKKIANVLGNQLKVANYAGCQH